MALEEHDNSRREDHVELRRRLRIDSTDAESLMWRLLRCRQMGGLKFRRQHQVGPYILDFYCPERRLAIEADGGQHLTKDGMAKDEKRTVALQSKGIRVLRFTNLEILLETEAVKEAIWLEVRGEPSP